MYLCLFFESFVVVYVLVCFSWFALIFESLVLLLLLFMICVLFLLLLYVVVVRVVIVVTHQHAVGTWWVVGSCGCGGGVLAPSPGAKTGSAHVGAGGCCWCLAGAKQTANSNEQTGCNMLVLFSWFCLDF